jgi:hypothetical protein
VPAGQPRQVFTASSADAAITAWASDTPAASRPLGWASGTTDRLGIVELVDDPRRERIVTADDDVTAHRANATSKPAGRRLNS